MRAKYQVFIMRGPSTPSSRRCQPRRRKHPGGGVGAHNPHRCPRDERRQESMQSSHVGLWYLASQLTMLDAPVNQQAQPPAYTLDSTKRNTHQCILLITYISSPRSLKQFHFLGHTKHFFSSSPAPSPSCTWSALYQAAARYATLQ